MFKCAIKGCAGTAILVRDGNTLCEEHLNEIKKEQSLEDACKLIGSISCDNLRKICASLENPLRVSLKEMGDLANDNLQVVLFAHLREIK